MPRVSRTALPSGAPYVWTRYCDSSGERVFENELDDCLEQRCGTQLQFDMARGEIDAIFEMATRGQLLPPNDPAATPVRLDPDLWEIRWSMNGKNDELRLYHGEPPSRPRMLLALKAHWKWWASQASAAQVDAAQDEQMVEASDRYRRTGLHP